MLTRHSLLQNEIAAMRGKSAANLFALWSEPTSKDGLALTPAHCFLFLLMPYNQRDAVLTQAFDNYASALARRANQHASCTPKLISHHSVCHWCWLFFSCNALTVLLLRRTNDLLVCFVVFFFYSASETPDFSFLASRRVSMCSQVASCARSLCLWDNDEG
jgi:hypothetical protein